MHNLCINTLPGLNVYVCICMYMYVYVYTYMYTHLWQVRTKYKLRGGFNDVVRNIQDGINGRLKW